MKHPNSVTRLMWMVLILTAWNMIRLGASIANWTLLKEFAPTPGPIYIAATASFWTLFGFALWILFDRRNPRSQIASVIFVLGYAAWWWADRLLFQAPSPNWPFALSITVILLAAAMFDIFNRQTTKYLRQRETHEQTPSDSNPA